MTDLVGSDMVLILVSLTCSLVCCEAAGKKAAILFPCPDGSFYLKSSQECWPCSPCAKNEVTKKPCQPYEDRLCGPFTEFRFFHQTADNSDKNSSTDSGQSKTEVHLTIYQQHDGSSGQSMARNVVQTEHTEYWRKVAFALIGALSALIFVATIVVLVTCRHISQTRRMAVRDGEDSDDADCPYVVIHTIRPSCSSSTDDVMYQVPPGVNALHQLTRQRRRMNKYRPKRRLLPANEYADDVFESEDSAGSRRRISLQAIPETGQSDNEAESGSVPPSENTPLQADTDVTEESEDKPVPQETSELLSSGTTEDPTELTEEESV